MKASVTARDLARASLVDSIKAAAGRQVAAEGAARLSVRAVAREVGMVSSAVYRYFPSRDQLLTALIIDAYDDLGAAVERAAAGVPRDRARERWRATCTAVRTWAAAGPQQYGLLFGSPVPGYRAPQDTVAPAGRVPTALMAVIQQGWVAGRVRPGPEVPVTTALSGQLAIVADALGTDLPPVVVLRAAAAWTQLFGVVTFELFGQLVGSFDPATDFFDAVVDAAADQIGLLPDEAERPRA